MNQGITVATYNFRFSQLVAVLGAVFVLLIWLITGAVCVSPQQPTWTTTTYFPCLCYRHKGLQVSSYQLVQLIVGWVVTGVGKGLMHPLRQHGRVSAQDLIVEDSWLLEVL